MLSWSCSNLKVVFELKNAAIGLKGNPDSPPDKVAIPGRVRTLGCHDDLFFGGWVGFLMKAGCGVPTAGRGEVPDNYGSIVRCWFINLTSLQLLLLRSSRC